VRGRATSGRITQDKLALFGGKPVRDTLLAYGHQTVEEEDIAAVVETLRSPWLTTGPKVQEFEEAVAAYVGAPNAVAVSSGTAALHAAAFAAGIGPGDEVIVPALTFAASANCVLYLGGKPVFADVRPDTLNLDPADLEAKITPRTKAVVTVDYAGQPCDYEAVEAIARRHGLVVIEDAAQALGASFNGRRVGSLNPLTTLSFHPVKSITTAEGGMVTTHDSALAQRLRAFRNHGITTDHRQRGSWLYDMDALGFNYRLSDIQCALGLSQLQRLEGWISRRGEIAACYTKAFRGLEPIQVPGDHPGAESAWHLYVIQLRLETLRVGREQVYAALRAENIGVNVHYLPVYWHSYYQRLGYQRGLCPVVEAAYERLVTLPLWPGMSDEDVDSVVAAVTKVVSAFQR